MSRFEQDEGLEDLRQLALPARRAQTVGPQLEQGLVVAVGPPGRSFEGREGFDGTALPCMDLRQLDEEGPRCACARLLHEPLEDGGERVVVALGTFEVGPRAQDRALVLGELARALDPGAGARRRVALMQMDLARLDGDRGAVAGAGGEVEAVFEEFGDDLPVLDLGREQERPFDGRGQQRIVFEGRGEARARAVAILEHARLETAQGEPERGPLGPAQSRGQSLEQARRLVGSTRLEAQLRQSFECGREVGVQREGAMIGALRFAAIAEVARPDAAEIGLELRSLVGGHRGRALELGDLQHHVPLTAAFVDAAQLTKRRAIRRVESSEGPVDLTGSVEIEDPLFEDLAEAQEKRGLLLAVGLDRGRGDPIAVDAGERRPIPFEEEMLLERLEGAAIVGIACEDLLLRVETFGQDFLVIDAAGPWDPGSGVFPTAYRPRRRPA